MGTMKDQSLLDPVNIDKEMEDILDQAEEFAGKKGIDLSVAVEIVKTAHLSAINSYLVNNYNVWIEYMHGLDKHLENIEAAIYSTIKD